MTQAHKLIDNIEALKYHLTDDFEQFILNLHKSSVKFYLGDDSVVLEKGQVDTSQSTVDEFYKNGLNLLPYETCLFEFKSSTNNSNNFNFFALIHCLDPDLYIFTPWQTDQELNGLYVSHGFYKLTIFDEDIAVSRINTTHVPHSGIDSQEKFQRMLNFFLEPIIISLRMMACSNIEVVDNTPSKLKQSRVKKGKTPLFTYKTLHITDAPKTKNKNATGGTHSSPRVHLRRGHIRKLSDTKTVWVQPCVVGDKSKGVIHKDYEFTTS